MELHNVFHATLLTPYKQTTLNGQSYQEPAPELIDGQPEWEVESILKVRRRRNQLQFLVRWKGFSEAHDSWEPAKNIHADELVEDFYKRHPAAIRSLSPPTIRSITMSNTPLSERIEDIPAPLPLIDHLSSPSPPTSSSPLPAHDEPLVSIDTHPPS